MAKNKKRGNIHLHQGTRQKVKRDICPRVSPASLINDKSYWKNLVNTYGIDAVMKAEGITLKELKILAGETLTEFMFRPKSRNTESQVNTENNDD